MGEDIGWASLEVRPDVDSFGPALGRGLNGPLDSIGRSSGKRFGMSFGKVAAGVGAGVLAGAYAAISIGKDAYAEAKEARKVGALTTSTIKATGGAANITAGQVAKLSEAISVKAGVDDEAIQTGANLLLTFKNVRNEVGAGNKIFNEATAAAVDLSAAGFGSIDSASKMLGKTLNDPVKGITALSRAGVTFTEQQKTKIASLVEENDLLGAQKIILGEVQSQVGGAAAAQADAGDKLGVVIGNIKEDIGTALMPAVDRFADWLGDKGPAAGRKFSGWLSDEAIPAIGNFVDEAKPLADEILPAVGSALGTVKDVLAEALPYAKDLVGAFNDMPDWAKKGLVGGAILGGAAAKLRGGGATTGGGILSGLSKAKPLPVYVVNGGALGLDVPGGKPKGGKLPLWLTGGGLPMIAGVGGAAAGAVTEPGNRNSMAPGSGGYGGDGGMTLPPSVQNLNDLDQAGDELRGLFKIFDDNKQWQDSDPMSGAMAHIAENATAAGRGSRRLSIDLYELAGNTDAVGKSSRELNERWNDLPSKVKTTVLTPGLVDSRKDVMDLKQKYDLTPREVMTIFRVTGLNEARTQVQGMLNTIYTTRVPAKETRDAEATGNPKGVVPTPNGKRAPIVINLPDGRQLDGYMDDRINAQNELTWGRR